MITIKYKPIHTLLILLISFSSSAEEYCQTFKNNQIPESFETTRHYTFHNRTLLCSTKTHFKSAFKAAQSIHNYQVVRSHINELRNSNVLASSQGYHLINENFKCDSDHCHHVDVMPLTQFKSIKSPNIIPTLIQKSNQTQELVDEINGNLWKSDVVTLSSWSRVSTSADNDSAQAWISNKMNSLNLQTSTQEFNVSGNTTRNIIGIKPGTSRANDWYIVGAHMDSIPSNGSAPGAVDNASGCAGVLELARIASQYTFESTLIFICFSGEEQGLIGSSFHVQSLINDGNQNKVKAVLTMDMIGYTNNASQNKVLFESSSSNQNLIDILAQNAATYAPELTVFTSTNPFGSDHVPYINNNMHGILTIDSDWNIYPDYHHSTDLPENLNLSQGEYILKTNLASLIQLATLVGTSDIVFKNGFETAE